MHTQYQKIRSITLKQLTYTLAAADEGSVSAAARKLHVSQPSISAAIAALERHYGLKLFTRHPAQGVSLTRFGVKVMAEARLLCDQAQTVASLASPDAGVSGEIGLCCYEAIAPHILPRLLLQLQEKLPGVIVRYTADDLEGVAGALTRGTADLAITYDLGLEKDILTETIYTLQPHVICSAEHAFAAKTSVRLSELHGQLLVLLDQPLSAQYVLGLLRSSGVEPVIAAQVRGFELHRSLVANGFGIAVVHTLPKTATAYDGRPVCAIPIADTLVEQRVLLACLAQNQSRPVLAAAQREIVASFASG
ncbi:MAG: LysR family transcriptional regulator [Alphaproteobacteria bacterium]|nr:LysR family transcriptional regulator [Alphaproteobacteria bacterium]